MTTARTDLARWLLEQATEANVPIAFEIAGLETDFQQGDPVLYTLPNGKQIPATVEQVAFDSHIGEAGAWLAFIRSERPAFTLTVWTPTDRLIRIEAVQA
ncbi:MAG: hypothetical protein K8L97_27215 [Anaerolineae bacterium]|nr:hypothetical protein [Anaerolineae bacterium]